MLGKALLTEPRVLLLDEPTRGIDVGAKADIFELMTQQTKQGLGVLFATSELEEALHVPDRLLVMSKGRIVRDVRRGAATREEIMAASEETTQRRGGSPMSAAPTPTVDAPVTAADLPSTAEGRRLKLVNMLFELRAFIALIVLIIVFGLLSDSYLTWDNLVTMTRHVAINAILAIGMLMVILTGGIDLSVGSIVGLAGIVAGVLLEGLHHRLHRTRSLYPPVWVVVLLVLAVGAGRRLDQRHLGDPLRGRALHRDARRRSTSRAAPRC